MDALRHRARARPVSVDRDAAAAQVDSAGRVSVPHADGRRVRCAGDAPVTAAARRCRRIRCAGHRGAAMTLARERFAKWIVVEIASGYGPAMIASKLLADLGCPVSKLEDRDGDPLRRRAALGGLSLFELLNASKDSVRADLAHARAGEVIESLLRTASIVVADRDGMAALDRWLPDQVERFPHVTVAACTPFGLRGTFANWNAGEEGIQALSGIMSTTHHPGGRPVRVAGAIATHTSAMHAVTS